MVVSYFRGLFWVPLSFDEDCIFKICVIVIHRTSTLLRFYFCTLKLRKRSGCPHNWVKQKIREALSQGRSFASCGFVPSLSQPCFLNSLPIWLSQQLAAGVLPALPFAACMLARWPAPRGKHKVLASACSLPWEHWSQTSPLPG